MTRRWAIVGGVALVAVAALLAAHRLIARHERRQALQLAEAGRFAEAKPLLEAALARDAGDAEALAALATGAIAAGDAAAEGYLSRWCELSPREARPWRLRMDLRHRQARSARAEADRARLLGLAAADGRRALELSPEVDEVRREVAWLLLNVGRFADAEAAVRPALARAPDDGWLQYLLARARHGQGDRAGAEALLDDVLARGPIPEALLLRATLHREAGRPQRAVPLLRQALEQERAPRKDCLYQLGLALAGAGQEAEARRALAELDLLTLQESVTRDGLPATPALRVQIAEAMLGAGRGDEAHAVLDGVLKDDPGNAAAKRLLARSHKEKK